MEIKRGMLNHQATTIDNERRKYNSLLSAKQNEIETLKEKLAEATKMNEELSVRCEILALMSGTAKNRARLAVTQYKMFSDLKENATFQRFAKNVMSHHEP